MKMKRLLWGFLMIAACGVSWQDAAVAVAEQACWLWTAQPRDAGRDRRR